MSKTKQSPAKQDSIGQTDSTMSRLLQEGVEAQRKLYEAWLEAMNQTMKKSLEAVALPTQKTDQQKPLPYEAFYDTWVNTYAKLFMEMMSTPLFASTVGQYLDSVLEVKQGLDHVTEKTLKALRLPTRSDLDEIHQRLVSLERQLHELTRQTKEISKKLD